MTRIRGMLALHSRCKYVGAVWSRKISKAEVLHLQNREKHMNSPGRFHGPRLLRAARIGIPLEFTNENVASRGRIW
jgi:hypothetical protein